MPPEPESAGSPAAKPPPKGIVWALGLLFIGFAIYFIHTHPVFKEYLTVIGKIAFSNAMEEVDVIEFLLAFIGSSWLVIFWLLKLSKSPPGPKESFWSFLREEKYRIGFFGLMFVAASLFVAAPYQEYKTAQQNYTKLYVLDQQTESNLETQVEFYSNGFSFDENMLMVEDEDNYPKWSHSGADAFFNKNLYSVSIQLFERAFAAEQTNWDKRYPANSAFTEESPIYYFAVLKTNLAPQNLSSQDRAQACIDFERHLNDMTNGFYEAVCVNKSPWDGCSSSNRLSANLRRLIYIKDLVPDSETNYINNIIDTVSNLEKRTTFP